MKIPGALVEVIFMQAQSKDIRLLQYMEVTQLHYCLLLPNRGFMVQTTHMDANKSSLTND